MRAASGGRPRPRPRSRARWTTLDWAASFTISAFWHVLVLMVLVLAVHPFQLPDASRAIDVELLPPLTPPLMPRVDLELRPREEETPKPLAPAPRPQLERALPQASVLPKLEEVKPTPAPRQLLDMARPIERQLEPPVEVERRPTRTQRLQTRQAAPNIPTAPPEPVTVTRLAPALSPPVEAPRTLAPSRRALDTSRAAPQLPQVATPSAPAAPATPAADAPIATAPSEAAPVAPSQVQVLTNEAVVQSPVEIRPRERAPAASRLNTQTGAQEIPSLPAGGGAAAGGEQAGGGQAGVGQPGGGQAGRPGNAAQGGLRPFTNGADTGALRGGLRTTLGCENPDAYKLTPQEREACLQRFAQRARGMDLGLPISAAKQAEYDHYEACRRATGGIAPSGSSSDGTSIRGLGANPTLKDCGPSTR